MQINSLAAVIALSLSTAALADAGGIGAIKVEPAKAQAGKEVKITVTAEGEAPTFCGLALDLGDGEMRDIKIDRGEAQFPVTVAKTYAKAGSYTIKAEGKKVTTHFPCNGKATATVVVAAASGAAPAGAAAAKTAVSCPEGYALKGAVGKAGEYTCKAKPTAPAACGAGLEPFAAGDSLGCRKAKARR